MACWNCEGLSSNCGFIHRFLILAVLIYMSAFGSFTRQSLYLALTAMYCLFK